MGWKSPIYLSFSWKLVLLLAGIILLSGSVAIAADYDYYVDARNGSNGNNGRSAGDAFKTIQKATDVVQAGDRVLVKAGVYYERIVVKASGTSSNPIVFEGEVERDADGNITHWRTVIDGSRARNISWKSEGSGMYSADLGFRPDILTVDGKQVGRMGDDKMTSGVDKTFGRSGFDLMTSGDSLELTTKWNGIGEFWDTLHGIYGYNNGKTYIRLRNKANPNGRDIAAGTDATGIVIANKGHIHFRNFEIRRFSTSININGSSATGNVIENNKIVNGRKRLKIAGGAHHNHIRNNDISMNFFGRRPNAWQGGSGDGELLYRFYKYFQGDSSSDDVSIELSDLGDSNEIYHNHVHDGAIGIRQTDAESGRAGTLIYGNVVGYHNSVGIVLGFVNDGTEIFNNIIHNNNIHLRLWRLQLDGKREMYIYSNRFYNPKGTGGTVWAHRTGGGGTCSDDIEFNIYHNSMSGGEAFFGTSTSENNRGCYPDGTYANNIPDFKPENNGPKTQPSTWTVYGVDRKMDFLGDDKDYFNTIPGSSKGSADDLPNSFPGMQKHYPDKGHISNRWPDPGPGHVQISVPDDEEPPTAPEDLEITDLQSNSISISWRPSTDQESGVKGYEVFRDGSSVGTTSATSYSDTGLVPETKYTYQVLAYDRNDNKSSRSDPVSGTTKEPGAAEYTLLKAKGSISLDGVLSKYDGASALTLKAPNGDNTVTFRGLWNETGIYLAFDVEDPDLMADTSAGKPWRDDSVEWFLDAQGNGGGDGVSGIYMDEDDYHGIVSIDNAYYAVRGTQDTSATQPWNGAWDSFVARDADNKGYRMEVEIPWSSLALPTPSTDMFMGFSFAVNDRDPSSTSGFMWPDIKGTYENASRWKRVKIAVTDVPGGNRPKAPGGLRVTKK
jgi:chitodextrinase